MDGTKVLREEYRRPQQIHKVRLVGVRGRQGGAFVGAGDGEPDHGAVLAFRDEWGRAGWVDGEVGCFGVLSSVRRLDGWMDGAGDG